MPSLFVIPCSLHSDGNDHIPPVILESLSTLSFFIVERTRSARRFVRSIIHDFPIDDCTFIEIDKHDPKSSHSEILDLMKQEKDIGLLSEAGTPCIADPGAWIINLAREKGFIIRPLTGPNSIILGLMASGMNGQNFTFHGYLPIKDQGLNKKLREISVSALSQDETQIFIETPYRNSKLLKVIKDKVHPDLDLCIAINLTGKNEFIRTKKVAHWKLDELSKEPAIFIIGQTQH